MPTPVAVCVAPCALAQRVKVVSLSVRHVVAKGCRPDGLGRDGGKLTRQAGRGRIDDEIEGTRADRVERAAVHRAVRGEMLGQVDGACGVSIGDLERARL